MRDGAFDAIVVGGGAMGSATARNLAMRGRRTLLVERFAFGHGNGSSGGPTRIFRLMYDSPGYVRLAVAAREAWDELQDAAGEPLLRVTGGLDVGPAATARAEVVRSLGVEAIDLDPGAARERWPAFRPRPHEALIFQPDGGVLRAERTVQVQARLAAEAGAEVRERTTVTSIQPGIGGAEVLTGDGERFWAGVVVVTAGPWAGPLLRAAGIDLPLRPSLEQASYYRLAGPAEGVRGSGSDAVLPTVIDWSWGDHPPYLVPDPFDPEPGSFKVGLHHSGPFVEADTRTFQPDPARIDGVQGWVGEHVEPATPLGRTDTCLYTMTPDEDFILDRVGPLVVASPCSGHGFKFVPLFGRVLADLATGTPPRSDLSPFALTRPGLRRSAPPS